MKRGQTLVPYLTLHGAEVRRKTMEALCERNALRDLMKQCGPGKTCSAFHGFNTSSSCRRSAARGTLRWQTDKTVRMEMAAGMKLGKRLQHLLCLHSKRAV